MAFREIRASWHRLLFFFICIAIGVGAIITLRSLVQNLSARVSREARSLLTADVQVSSNTAWTEDDRTKLERYFSSPLIESSTEMIDVATMVRPVAQTEGALAIGGAPKLAEAKAVQQGYPFYGELVLGEGARYDFGMLRGRGVLVKPALLAALNAKIGDRVRIGTLEFTIRGTIEQEPGNTLSAFSFGPRVMISLDDARAAGLLGFGSRARYRVLFKTHQNGDGELLRLLREDFRKRRDLSSKGERTFFSE